MTLTPSIVDSCSRHGTLKKPSAPFSAPTLQRRYATRAVKCITSTMQHSSAERSCNASCLSHRGSVSLHVDALKRTSRASKRMFLKRMRSSVCFVMAVTATGITCKFASRFWAGDEDVFKDGACRLLRRCRRGQNAERRAQQPGRAYGIVLAVSLKH